MRVLLSTYGSRGDVEPMVALAVQLQDLGAEVRMCAPPDEEFVELLAGAGVPLVPYERPWRTWERPSTPEDRARRVSEFIEAQYDTLATAAKGCDGLLATAMSIFVARSAAEQAAIPHRFVAFAPPVVEDIRAQDWKAMFGEPVSAHRASIGLPEVEDVGEFLFTDRPLLAADPALGPLRETPGLDVAHTGAWILPDERPLPAELEAFLNAGTPPVYVGFGSMRTATEETGRAAIEAVRAQGCRVLLARGWAGLALIDDQDDCFAVGEINQQALFGRVAAVVHHGGAGTTTTAARAGAPQVIVPQAGGDQPYWARRIVELGIGAAHDGPAPTAESLSAVLEPALTAETRTRAAALAARVRTDGAAVAAKLLLDAFS
jgi:vancomycin aglycone glucosyltransferase